VAFLFPLLIGAFAVRAVFVPALFAFLLLLVVAGLLRRIGRILAAACAAAVLILSLYGLALLLIAARTILPARALAPLLVSFAGLALLEAVSLFVIFRSGRSGPAPREPKRTHSSAGQQRLLHELS
jgi:hypothetical protein